MRGVLAPAQRLAPRMSSPPLASAGGGFRAPQEQRRIPPAAGHALIAGGGIGGMAAALCLARIGCGATVFERAPEFGELGAGIQLSPNASRVLHHLGLAPKLEALACLPEGIEFRHWRTGRRIAHVPLGATAVEAYGFPYYHIHRGDLLRILVDAAQASRHITLRPDAIVRGFEQARGQVRLTVQEAGAEAIHAGNVLVGADGIHSTVRAGMFDDEAPTFTGNVAWRALVPAERLPAGVAPQSARVWWGPRRHFVHYPVRGGALVNCVCVVEKSGWQREGWLERGERHELKGDFGGWHRNILTLIDCMDPDSLYRSALCDRRPLAHWSYGAATLLGDACHPMLPFMAQGAAAAIEDAAVLAACLAAAKDVPAALGSYEGLRRDRATAMQRQSRRNGRLFHLAGLAAWARNRGARRGLRSMDRIYGYDALRGTG